MSNDSRKSIRTLPAIRKEIGSAIWLFVAYADMAAKGWSAHDDDLAHVLGTSKFTILRWKIKLINTDLISIEDTQDGGTSIVINRDVLFENSFCRAGDQPGADEPDLGEESASLDTSDREFLHECGIEVEET